MAFPLQFFVTQCHTDLFDYQPSREKGQTPESKVKVNTSNICKDRNSIKSVLYNCKFDFKMWTGDAKDDLH